MFLMRMAFWLGIVWVAMPSGLAGLDSIGGSHREGTSCITACEIASSLDSWHEAARAALLQVKLELKQEHQKKGS